MENNKKELMNWALAEFRNKINIYEQRWTYFESQPYFDYRTILNIDGIKYEGRGVNSSQADAINSSIAEALERYALKYFKLTNSNGCALHSDLDKAIKNSKQELIERHYVMLFTLGHYNGEMVSKNELPIKVVEILKSLEKSQIDITFYKLLHSSKQSVTLCQLSGLNTKKKFGTIFGSSCKDNLSLSIESSLKEVLPNLMAHLNKNILPMSMSEFQEIKNPGPADHLSLYLDHNFSSTYLSLRKLIAVDIPELDTNLFSFTLIDYPYKDLYPAIKATHPSCLQAQWGILQNTTPHNNNPLFPFVLP